MPFSLSTVRARLQDYFSKPGTVNQLNNMAHALLETADALETAQRELRELKLRVVKIEKNSKAT